MSLPKGDTYNTVTEASRYRGEVAARARANTGSSCMVDATLDAVGMCFCVPKWAGLPHDLCQVTARVTASGSERQREGARGKCHNRRTATDNRGTNQEIDNEGLVCIQGIWVTIPSPMGDQCSFIIISNHQSSLIPTFYHLFRHHPPKNSELKGNPRGIGLFWLPPRRGCISGDASVPSVPSVLSLFLI